ncbi:hypothetical protein K438DRAFT_1632969 [Mycena galopus ATCC 62051]|nr:hypothetical protein K438DRAFT_1632969 [Mycena galopus ATCC 62051]
MAGTALPSEFDWCSHSFRNPKLILDGEGRIVAVLLGRPEGDNWDDVIERIRRVMDRVRKHGVRLGVFRAKNKLHRRGNFHVVQAGYTKGPGQKKPGNLAHVKDYRWLVDLILTDRATRRIGGFQSSGLARYAPKLYQYQRATMCGILENHLDIRPPLSNSVYPTITCNLGPDVVTPEHLNTLNNPFGLCAITAAGNFDHTRGGHIFMKQLRLACEFPSGSTILLLSGTCEHGNTPIQTGETRYSITQYAAGALFRWAANGYKSTKALLAQPGGAALKSSINGEPGTRAAWGFRLLSHADELEADRAAVFGPKGSAVAPYLV